MLFDTHVYIGPSLDLASAKNILPNAHYHPPIQCGELSRLLRLDPKRVLIIDGYYEFTPAVWHKEILHAMDQGVEIWGAASMGALRAAELHKLGMKGIGQIFEDFKNGKLNDDDEVAVLHTSEMNGFTPINDAMINIRLTLLAAHEQGVISLQTCDQLIAYCKEQFYPYRLLSRAIENIAPEESAALTNWLQQHGMIDQKKLDSIAALEMLQKSAYTHTPREVQTPMTGYLKALLNYASATPFKHQADWLPDVEKQFQSIAKDEPIKHQLLAELSVFMHQFSRYAPDNVKVLNADMVIKYIKENGLYCPEDDFAFLKQEAPLSDLYSLIIQLICESQLTPELIQRYLPCIAHYYHVPAAQMNEQINLLLKRLLVIIMLMKTCYVELNVIVDNHYVTNHLSMIATKRGYEIEKAQQWIDATHLDTYHFMSFLIMYLMSSGCVQSFNSLEKSNHIHYSKWVHSVLNSV